MLKFDIRDKIKFKFTNKESLEEDYDSQFFRDIIYPTKDKDGYYKLRLFDLLILYGKDIFDMIEKDVIINDKYIFDIVNGMAEIEVTQIGEFWFKQKFGEDALDNFPITRDRYRLIPFGQILYYYNIGMNLSMNSEDIIAMNLYIDAKELTNEEFGQMHDETNPELAKKMANKAFVDQGLVEAGIIKEEQPKKLVKKPKKNNKGQQ